MIHYKKTLKNYSYLLPVNNSNTQSSKIVYTAQMQSGFSRYSLNYGILVYFYFDPKEGILFLRKKPLL
jgi:hypothetical protein